MCELVNHSKNFVIVMFDCWDMIYDYSYQNYVNMAVRKVEQIELR